MNCQIFKKFTLVNKDPLVVVKMIQVYVTCNIYYRYNDNAIRNLKSSSPIADDKISDTSLLATLAQKRSKKESKFKNES